VNLLPTDNGFDVPSLRADLQATEIPSPVLPWGAISRARAMLGTFHFYTHDVRFSAFLKDPPQILETGCTVAVEPNISIFEQMPRWEVIHGVGRKRTVAAHLQALGVRILVDINVPMRFRDIAMAGVPRGWRAFATRGYAERPDDLREEHDLACEWARGVPLMLVVGGGRGIEELCRTLAGVAWVPDYRSQVRALAAGPRTPGRMVQECQKA
jgi:hypothetical protein